MAKEVRAGLELTEASTVEKNSVVESVPAVTSRLDEIWMRRTIRQHLREFAQVFAVVFLVFSGVTTYKHGVTSGSLYWFGAAMLVLGIGYTKPLLLHPLWKGWMALGHGLGIVMSFVILGLAWIIMLVPIAILLKVLRVRVMDTSYGAAVDTYWETRDPKLNDFALMLKRQF